MSETVQERNHVLAKMTMKMKKKMKNEMSVKKLRMRILSAVWCVMEQKIMT